jgi:UDP-2,3-diacylglucosamine pyrophosphatase LpxH
MTYLSPDRTYRTIWISDVHLGTRGCQAEFLLDFLKHNEAETYYLVGDIFDGWRMKKSWYWTQAHNDVIQKLLRKTRKGSRIIYIPGNHDEALRNFSSTMLQFGGISLQDEAIHQTADGRRLLVIHGDSFDGVVKYAKWLALLGDWAYTAMLGANIVFNRVRRRLGYGYWSLSAYLKAKVKNAVEFVGDYERAIADEARRRGVDGIVCGHIHKPEMREIDGTLYCNCGDWVESCSALVENLDGTLEIIHWMQQRGFDPLTRGLMPQPEVSAVPAE